MNLTKLVLDKIKELGETEAATFFGVSRQTVYAWKKTKKPPVTAAQKVLDEGSLDVISEPDPALVETEQESVPLAVSQPEENPEQARQRRTNLAQWQLDTDNRLTKIETWIRIQTDPDAKLPSSVRPAAPIPQAQAQPAIVQTGKTVQNKAPTTPPVVNPRFQQKHWNEPTEPRRRK